jgi:enterochelin esterase-like enzyme
MRIHTPHPHFFLLVLLVLATACDPLAPYPTPTPVVFVVTAEATNTPTATPTRAATSTPLPSATPLASATPTLIPCQAEGGQVITFDDFRSEVAGETLPYQVYVPPCYLETQKRYPVLILLHGLGETEAQWVELGVVEALEDGIEAGSLPPMLLVIPSMGDIGVENEFPPDDSYETVVLEELLPAIDRDFCTIDDRNQRAIGGISRGGFWAYSIAMRHPDVFGIVGGHSAFFDADNAPPANNPLELALNTSFLTEANLQMYLDNAAVDFVGANQELFSSRLSARGIPHTYIINPVGDHNNDYWRSHVNEYLTFYGRNWTRDPAALPGCAS